MTEGTPEDERSLLRGNPKNVGPVVPRRMIRALASDRESATPAVGSGRLELARRIADPANPLTARVAVNRVWHHLFGRGLVPSVDNFGALGDRPSHPELLDDLADRFVRDGWSIKRLVRELVLSSTFRMASTSSPEAEAADPDNRLLHRMPVRRLEAEAIRDAILAVSGRLDGRMGGPRRRGPPHAVHGQLHRRLRPAQGQRPARRRRAAQPLPHRPAELPDADAGRLRHAPAAGHGRAPRRVERPGPGADPDERPVRRPAGRGSGRGACWRSRGSTRPAGSGGCTWTPTPGRRRRPNCKRPCDSSTATATSWAFRPDVAAIDERIWADFAHVLFNVKEFIFLN